MGRRRRTHLQTTRPFSFSKRPRRKMNHGVYMWTMHVKIENHISTFWRAYSMTSQASKIRTMVFSTRKVKIVSVTIKMNTIVGKSNVSSKVDIQVCCHDIPVLSDRSCSVKRGSGDNCRRSFKGGNASKTHRNKDA